jgi:lipoprotein-anchoring transpeptidase ErfK/SrfK
MHFRPRPATAVFWLALSLVVAFVAPAHARELPRAWVAEGLGPGEFRFDPDAVPAGPVLVVVSLDDQLAHVYRDGLHIGTSTVSTGRPGHSTPTGVFDILERKTIHYSNLYEGPNGGAAPMPYMQRLTWDGVALHAGRVPGHRASHGCIRLPPEFARQLFGITRRGTTVVVADAASLATLDFAGLPADMAKRVFERPWASALPALAATTPHDATVATGGGGTTRAD